MTVAGQKKSLQENWFETIFHSSGYVAKALSYLKCHISHISLSKVVLEVLGFCIYFMECCAVFLALFCLGFLLGWFMLKLMSISV